MKCPECSHKLTTKNYDAEFEWYECPGCEGAFTVNEIQGGSNESGESENGRQQGNRAGAKGKKTAGSRRKKRKDSEGENGRVQEGNGKPIAKGKKRRTEIEEDDEAVKEWEKEILTPVKTEQHKRHRDEIDSRAVIGTWADEIQEVYAELGVEIDEANAEDKAIILWREIHHLQGVAAREQEVPHALCKEHA